MLRVAICQSNYLPWKGYFDLISAADLFIFHDDVQYTKQDWRNRNRIKTPDGVRWLTIPVGSAEDRLVCEVELLDNRWQAVHWRRIRQSYSKAPYFELYRPALEEIYLGRQWTHLSDLNQHTTQVICGWMGIETPINDSLKFSLTKRKGGRVIELLDAVGATHYLSGPAARAYLNVTEFERRGITLEWMDYSGYPEYDQLWPPFRHDVTVLDLLFHLGDEAQGVMHQSGCCTVPKGDGGTK